MESLLHQFPSVLAMGLIGAIVFAAIGLVSGTDETTTIAPLTLLVALLGVPPASVFTFFCPARWPSI
jgi:putative tricarboxylic transport membrane protein